MISIRTFERASKRTMATIDGAKSATFRFADGSTLAMPLRTRTPRLALQVFAVSLRDCASLDDALRETACNEALSEDMPEASLDGLVEIMDKIEQTAVDGRPDRTIQVTFH